VHTIRNQDLTVPFEGFEGWALTGRSFLNAERPSLGRGGLFIYGLSGQGSTTNKLCGPEPVHLSHERGDQQLDNTPQDFDAVRRQWEYSHAINAVLSFVALVAITFSTLTYKHEIEMTQTAKE